MKSFFYTGKEHCKIKCGFDEFGLVYVTKGEAELVTADNTSYVCTGHVGVINLTKKVVQIQAEKGCDYYVLHIMDSQMVRIISRYLHEMQIPDDAIVAIPAGKQQNSILDVFSKLHTETWETPKEKTQQLDLLEELMARLHRASLKTLHGNRNNRLGVVGEVREYLKREYNRNITLEELAMRYDMSVSYLSHVFKETTGISIMRYLLCHRIAVAKEYLENSNLPVGEIARKCGFHDSSNFGRTFKKETGISPRRYRTSYTNE